MKKALITGISGQDGSYLAEFLLTKGYEVHGLVQRLEMEDPERNLWRISHLLDKVTLHPGSIESFPSLFRIFEKLQPNECYHLAAASFVSYSFDDEFAIFNSNINGTHYILSAIKESSPNCRFYFAGSSEMFGNAKNSPQNELSSFHPRSPYGITKVTGFHLTSNYRESYGLFACNGILYNHESERRGFEYVTRKITSTVAKIKLGLATELRLGNLDAKRDWGYAPDYVKAMWFMLQGPEPDDYVIATGEPHSVREFVITAFQEVGLDWEKYVIVDPQFFRPAEKHILAGDATKAHSRLGWNAKVGFSELVSKMVQADLARLKK
ncbi:MAG: GDP-mannose 4,6-dehydratase [Chloroflexi bacterium]|nr:GDP-mannose 4,6-dehydratase [Chloroflexota bacterium]